MDSMNVNRVRHILQQHFPKTEWNISLPDDGQHTASYFAQSEELHVFIKFDVPAEAIQRLSDIQVAPRIVARTSFAIALWHVEHEFDCTDFLQDFLVALNKSNNPRAVYQ